MSPNETIRASARSLQWPRFYIYLAKFQYDIAESSYHGDGELNRIVQMSLVPHYVHFRHFRIVIKHGSSILFQKNPT